MRPIVGQQYAHLFCLRGKNDQPWRAQDGSIPFFVCFEALGSVSAFECSEQELADQAQMPTSVIEVDSIRRASVLRALPGIAEVL